MFPCFGGTACFPVPWIAYMVTVAEVTAISIPAATSIGHLYEVATMWWGRLMGIDPFDQPGVERGKVVTVASLTGSPADAAAALARHRAVPRQVAM